MRDERFRRARFQQFGLRKRLDARNDDVGQIAQMRRIGRSSGIEHASGCIYDGHDVVFQQPLRHIQRAFAQVGIGDRIENHLVRREGPNRVPVFDDHGGHFESARVEKGVAVHVPAFDRARQLQNVNRRTGSRVRNGDRRRRFISGGNMLDRRSELAVTREHFGISQMRHDQRRA